MKIIKKFILGFLLTLAILELLKFGTGLMNQRDDYQFYLGLLIVSAVIFPCTVILFNELYKLSKKIKSNKNN